MYPFVSQTADDFMFATDMLVTDVHWWGGFWNGPPDDVEPCDFYIYIYADDGTGTMPTGAGMADPAPTALASYFFPGVSGLPLDVNGFYEYDVDLSPGFCASAGVKYWIAIQADFLYPPQWGWTETSAIQLHQAMVGFPFLGTPFWTDPSPPGTDMAFYLTGLPGCEEWPDHKMHFPQLPDEIGWDVNAAIPKMLADDWQCSQTGWVTDIHFWGSWRGDNVATPMPWFGLSIWSNLPVGHPDNPYPYSIPGEELWFWQGEIQGTPFDPPTYEGWYDPNTDSSICNDHMSFWRYDFFVDQAGADSFFQYEGEIYWLGFSVVDWYLPAEWGWKTSRDHFMDDAVYSDQPYTGVWFEMYEPPRCNWFDVYFDATETPEDLGSTNYYGDGWYYYPDYNWWNMWFYNNPFTLEQEKHIWMDFVLDDMTGAAEFAINWSTPEWDALGMGRPPLPADGMEFLYIGRQEFTVYNGTNTIDFWLYWNPEWISIDFRGGLFFVEGWIWHECVGTSMDLAFVITGHEGDPPVICGDVNADGIVNVGDIVYLVSYLYRGGPAPVPMSCVGDVNNDDIVNVGDIVYLVSYLYRGGPAPDPNCCNPPWKQSQSNSTPHGEHRFK